MAKPFVFKLEPVLEQRLRAERALQRRVAELERERIGLEERLRGLQGAIVGAKDELRSRLSAPASAESPGVGVQGVRLQANASLHLAARAQRAVLELAGVHRRLESERAGLLAAASARKAVELLKSRQHEAWKRDLARREAAELDEIATMRASGKGPNR